MNELLKEWVDRLKLSDWVIELETDCKPDDIGENSGLTEWQEVNKTAIVKIIDPKFYGERITPFDGEKTLVHELLHLKTCLISDTENELQERIMHQLIEDLAKAFVDAKRHGENTSAAPGRRYQESR